MEFEKLYVDRSGWIRASVLGALEAHARDELGINEITQARPLQGGMKSQHMSL